MSIAKAPWMLTIAAGAFLLLIGCGTNSIPRKQQDLLSRERVQNTFASHDVPLVAIFDSKGDSHVQVRWSLVGNLPGHSGLPVFVDIFRRIKWARDDVRRRRTNVPN